VIGTFLVVGIIFIPIGIVIQTASNNIFEMEQDYQDEANYATLNFDIAQDVELPIFLYYKLTNFYQNHRRYVKSRSDAQLQGDEAADLSACAPLDVSPTDPDLNLYPCGLIANSYFNDTFAVKFENSTVELAESAEDIAWKSDVEKFRYRDMLDDETNVGPGGFALPRVDNPHFMVWMRTAGLPTFKKLYARIDAMPDGSTTLSAGSTLQIDVVNTFPVTDFSGQKFVVISTTSWLGGKNKFLGDAYVAVGAVSIVLAVLFLIKHLVSPRKLGDMKYFNWPEMSKSNH